MDYPGEERLGDRAGVDSAQIKRENKHNKKLKYRKEYYAKHIEEEKQRNAKWREANPIYNKEWYEVNKKKRLEQMKKYYENNRQKKAKSCKLYYEVHHQKYLEINKEWRKNNPDKMKEYQKKWRMNNIGKVKEKAKRQRNRRKRDLGFVPLNKHFKDSEAHHLDKVYVVYIPKEYHKNISHCLGTGRNIDEINQVALDFVCKKMAEEYL